MILLVGGEKGGPGKTTIATNLAAIRSKKQPDTLLIDTDKQFTASFWCGLRESNKVQPHVKSVQKHGRSLRYDVLDLSKKYKDIIIDAGGSDSAELRSALVIADKVIFPCRASQYDYWTLDRMEAMVHDVTLANPKLRAYALINQTPPNSNKELESAIKAIKDYEHIRLLNATIGERIVFRRSATEGKAVVEYLPSDNKANEEMMNLYMEIYYEEK